MAKKQRKTKPTSQPSATPPEGEPAPQTKSESDSTVPAPETAGQAQASENVKPDSDSAEPPAAEPERAPLTTEPAEAQAELLIPADTELITPPPLDVTGPGIYMIPMDYYHGHEAISKSNLSTFIDKSPRHYYYNKHERTQDDSKETPAMRAGKMIHTALLEPELFNEQYQVLPTFTVALTTGKGKRRSKEEVEQDQNALIDQVNQFLSGERTEPCIAVSKGDIAVATEFVSDIANKLGREVATAEEVGAAQTVAKNGLAIDMVARLFKGGMVEHSLFWHDKPTGLLCKSRPDFLRLFRPKNKDPYILCADLKSTVTAAPGVLYNSFGGIAAKFHYHIQGAMIRDAVWAQPEWSGMRFYFVLVAIEREPPYVVSPFIVSNAILDHGRKIYQDALAKIAICTERKQWPSYALDGKFLPLELPRWAMPTEAQK